MKTISRKQIDAVVKKVLKVKANLKSELEGALKELSADQLEAACTNIRNNLQKNTFTGNGRSYLQVLEDLVVAKSKGTSRLGQDEVNLIRALFYRLNPADEQILLNYLIDSTEIVEATANEGLALFIFNIANIGTLQQEQKLHKVLEKFASDIDLQDLSDLSVIENELNRLSSEQITRLEKLLENNYSEREQRMFSKASRITSSRRILASLGEDRDDVADKLISARNLILEASDSLADAYNHLGKISSSEAEKLKTEIMNVLDGEEKSIAEDLHKMIKRIKAASLPYED
jgi:hypothetical protein